MKLSYRGITYESTPPTLEIPSAETTEKYRGQVPIARLNHTLDKVAKAPKEEEIQIGVYRLNTPLSVEEILQKIQTAESFRQQKKWLVLYYALVDHLPVADITKLTGTSISTVHQILYDYNRCEEV